MSLEAAPGLGQVFAGLGGLRLCNELAGAPWRKAPILSPLDPQALRLICFILWEPLKNVWVRLLLLPDKTSLSHLFFSAEPHPLPLNACSVLLLLGHFSAV